MGGTTTFILNTDLDDHQFIKKSVEFLFYAMENIRKYSTDVKDLGLTHCLVQI